jgi:hypothetical protein
MTIIALCVFFTFAPIFKILLAGPEGFNRKNFRNETQHARVLQTDVQLLCLYISYMLLLA